MASMDNLQMGKDRNTSPAATPVPLDLDGTFTIRNDWLYPYALLNKYLQECTVNFYSVYFFIV